VTELSTLAIAPVRQLADWLVRGGQRTARRNAWQAMSANAARAAERRDAAALHMLALAYGESGEGWSRARNR
jgi:hypothetical protein